MAMRMLQPDERARLKPCLHCGYSLRHNIDARNCPECGLAVRVSLRDGDALDWSNPAWLRSTARATGLIVVAHLGLLAALLLVQAAYFAVVVSRRDLFRAISFVTPISGLLLAGGALLLASPEGRHPDRLAAQRFFLRLGGALLAGLAAWELSQAAGWVRGPWLPGWMHATATVIALLAVWGYLHELARRLPSRRCMSFIWALSVMLLLAELMLWFSVSPRSLLVLMRVVPWRYPGWPWTVTALVYMPLATGLLLYCWRQFRSAAREADRNWVTDP